MNDCLIAAVAMRADLPVLHADKDFDALAEHTALRVIP
jgi:predicted nucleic acid-binding protein